MAEEEAPALDPLAAVEENWREGLAYGCALGSSGVETAKVWDSAVYAWIDVLAKQQSLFAAPKFDVLGVRTQQGRCTFIP
eukprot:6178693-Pleurochrysis_carterae.AAC.1